MSDILKNIRLLAQDVRLCSLNLGDRLLVEWILKHRRRLLKFKDIHRGESCFIIGNGPSLNKMDLSLLKGHRTFGLNKIFLLFDRVDLDISYHVSVNSLVIEQSIREFEALKCPSFLSFGAARNCTRNRDHVYMLATDSYFATPYSFYSDPLHPMCEGFTVTYVALQLAYFMGFTTVYLIGVDHNFKAAGSPNEQQHLRGADENHFDSRYFSNMQWHLPDLEASEVSYRLAQFFYHRDGRRIFDATVDGKLQVFPKISYLDALNAT